jgi:hypothetical protein
MKKLQQFGRSESVSYWRKMEFNNIVLDCYTHKENDKYIVQYSQ